MEAGSSGSRESPTPDRRCAVKEAPMNICPGYTGPCSRVRQGMECPECEYPYSEAAFPLDPNVPHVSWPPRLPEPVTPEVRP